MNKTKEAAKRLTGSYIVRLAGCASCLNTRLDMCADENGYRTKNMMARRALIASEHALKGIQVTQNAVWSQRGDFNAIVKYDGAPAMTAIGHLDLTLELLEKAEEQIVEYLENPAAIDEDRPMMKGLLEWVSYCRWDLGELRESPKPEVERPH